VQLLQLKSRYTYFFFKKWVSVYLWKAIYYFSIPIKVVFLHEPSTWVESKIWQIAVERVAFESWRISVAFEYQQPKVRAVYQWIRFLKMEGTHPYDLSILTACVDKLTWCHIQNACMVLLVFVLYILAITQVLLQSCAMQINFHAIVLDYCYTSLKRTLWLQRD
jgi:hypothetical protein